VREQSERLLFPVVAVVETSDGTEGLTRRGPTARTEPIGEWFT
jgi:hypothetical protein